MKLHHLAYPLVLVACGGDTATTDGGSSDATSAPDTAMMPVSDAGPSDATGSDAQGTVEGGSDPGVIACGPMKTCMTPDLCCITGTLDAGPMYNCTPASGCQMGGKIACDEKADCTGNQICCGGLQGGMMGLGNSCQNMCGMLAVQLCKTSGECLMGTCQTYTCPVIGKISSCTKPFPQCM